MPRVEIVETNLHEIEHTEIVSIDSEWQETFMAKVRLRTDRTNEIEVLGQLLGGPRSDNKIQLPTNYKLAPDHVVYASLASNIPRVVCLQAQVVYPDNQFTEENDSNSKHYPKDSFIDCIFGLPPWDIVSIDEPSGSQSRWIISEEFEQAGEFINLPGEQIYWKNEDETFEAIKEGTEAPGKFSPQGTWVFTSYFVPAKLVEGGPQYKAWIATVNSKPKLAPLLNLVFMPETLLFEAPMAIPRMSPFGRYYDIQFTMRWRAEDPALSLSKWRTTFPQGTSEGADPTEGWNTFPRAGVERPQPLYYFDSAETYNIFRPYNRLDPWETWVPNAIQPRGNNPRI